MKMEKENYLSMPQDNKKVFILTKIKKIDAWTKDEDEILFINAEKYGYRQWKKIASTLSNRSSIQCSARYKRIRPGIVKGNWVREEDVLVMDLVEKFGKNWSVISKHIPSRTGKQIRDRYLNTLDSNINKDKFSSEEDGKIIDLYLQYGAKWSRIAKFFKKRTGDIIKNRFYSTLRKKIHGNDVTKKNSNRRIKSTKKLKKCTSTRAEETNLEIKVIHTATNEIILNVKNEIPESNLLITQNNNNLINNYENNNKKEIEAPNCFSVNQKESSFTPFNKLSHISQQTALGFDKSLNDFQFYNNSIDLENSLNLQNQQRYFNVMNDYLVKIKCIESSMNQSLYNYLNYSKQYQMMSRIYNSYITGNDKGI